MAAHAQSQQHPYDEGMYSSDNLKNVTLDNGTRVVTSPQTDIKRPVCAGIDVHKSILMATVCVTDKETLKAVFYVRQFTSANSDIRRMAEWLTGYGVRDVCMESTGKYWVPVLNVLEPDLRVVIVNPKWVKAIKGNKDDVKDSKWIGELFCFGLVRSSFIPSKDIRILREYTRYRYKLVNMRSSEKNRFQNGFTVCNIALDSVVSDMFGKSASEITNYLLTDENPNAEHCATMLHRSLKKKAVAVVESIEGFQLTEEQKFRMRQVLNHKEYLDLAIDLLDSKLEALTEPYAAAIKLLCTIPGMNKDSATTIISEIGTDMSQFDSSKRLCSWAGLTPGNNQSAGKKKSVKITRAGVYIKPMLVQVAHAAVKCTSQPYYKIKYENITRRRGKKRAIIAIARMILTAIYHMLQTGEVFNPSDLKQIDIPEKLKVKKKQREIHNAIKLLKQQGVLAEDFATSTCV